MISVVSLLMAWCLFAADPVPTDVDAADTMQSQWRPILDRVATEYELKSSLESPPLELLSKPTYTWARPGAHGGTYGAVYVWTHQGCAEAVGCFWRSPDDDGTMSIAHELHSLSPKALSSGRDGPHRWKAEAGLKRAVVPNAPTPASSAVARLQQMRSISRDFSAYSVSSRGERTELRLLPQPLYRYQSTNPNVVDGALLAFVCTIGTDPELFLVVEAIKTDAGPQWCYALARFSHMNLFVRHKDQEVWTAVRDAANPISHNADNTYWLFHELFDSSQLKIDLK